MRKVLGLLLLLVAVSGTGAQERQDTIVVSRDGTGNFRTLQEAIESARAFMDYTVTILSLIHILSNRYQFTGRMLQGLWQPSGKLLFKPVGSD